ncbi:MAG: alpha/beta hydrolase [Pseudomonadota bacterium]|nr:alpha/beta hydrolase [Pseudomonadota bacterium]
MSKTIVMIHGMASGGWAWDNYRSVFEAAGYTCLTPMLPLHDVDPHAEPNPALGQLSLLDYAKSLEQLISSLPERPILMGHSMGGLLAQILAARGLASAAVLITSAPPAGILALKPSVLRTFFPIVSRWKFWEQPFRFSQASAEFGILGRLSPAQRAAEFAKFVPESGRAAFEIGYWPFDRRRASHIDAKDVTCPMLVIGATEDQITPASVVRQIAEKYPTASYRQYNQHAHMIMIEAGWQTVAQDVLHWVNQHSASIDG